MDVAGRVAVAAGPRDQPHSRSWLMVSVATGLYLFWFRIHGLTENFALLDDQIRDWSIAHRSLTELPLMGPPSLSGIATGPVYYMLLWLGRSMMTPLLGHLPHVGGWFTALFQSAADVAVMLALAEASRSIWLAGIAVVAVATSPVDAGLSGSIWNPPIAIALVKFAVAAALAASAESPRAAGFAAVIFAGLAAQVHLSAILVAIPLVLCMLGRLWRSSGAGDAAVAGLCGLIAASPVVISAALAVHAGAAGVGSSISSTLADPVHNMRLAASAKALGDALETILLHPFQGAWIRIWLLLGAVATIPSPVSSTLRGLSVGPLVTAVLVFAIWQGQFGERYHYLAVALPAVVCLLAPVALVGRRWRIAALALLAGAVALLQPARARETWHGASRLREYGPLTTGATRIATAGVAVCRVQPGFPAAAGMDPVFLVRMAGGTVSPDANLSATIGGDGTVTFRPGC